MIRYAVKRIFKYLIESQYSATTTRQKILNTDKVNYYCNQSSKLTKGEKLLYDKLKVKFPSATYIDVVDMSGGCGGMYNIVVCTPDFKDIKAVKQHQIVNEALKEELTSLHGWRIYTSHEKEPAQSVSKS